MIPVVDISSWSLKRVPEHNIPVGTSAMRYAMKNADPTLEKSLPVNFKSFERPMTFAY